VFYNLLRPSLVQQNKKALSSDAFSVWGTNDPMHVEYNTYVVSFFFSFFFLSTPLIPPSSLFLFLSFFLLRCSQVALATKRLYQLFIPKFALHLEEKLRDAQDIDPARLVVEMHTSGINVRMMGRVRNYLSNELSAHLRKVLLTEMTARVIKNKLQEMLREKMQSLRISVADPYKGVAFTYLDFLFSRRMQMPSFWSVEDAHGPIRVIDKVTAEHCGKSQKSEAAMIRADCPVPEWFDWYYFEIMIENEGDIGDIAIGLWPEDKVVGMPGWSAGVGYHGDDGKKYAPHTKGLGEEYGPSFKTGDVIGLFWSRKNGTVFFTKNGEHLGVAFHDVFGRLYPVVGMGARGQRVIANFGQNKFFFDVKVFCRSNGFAHTNYSKEERLKKRYWSHQLKNALLSKFLHALNEAEMKTDFDLKNDGVDQRLLIRRIQQLSGIKISRRAELAIAKGNLIDFRKSDIVSIEAKGNKKKKKKRRRKKRTL
jgi:hypothetical protein